MDDLKCYFVYVLYSEKCDRYYIGYSQNPHQRLMEKHNLGKVTATKNCQPYNLMGVKKFESQFEAIQEERRLKKMKSRKYLEHLLRGNW